MEGLERDLSRRTRALSSLSKPYVLWPLLGVVLVLGALLFWAGHYIPFQDLVSHAGIAALRVRLPGSAVLGQNFVHAPYVGSYVFFRFIADSLVSPIGALAALRVLGTLGFLAMPVALVLAKRIVFESWDARPGLVGACLSLGLMTLLGFSNFQVGEAMAVISWAALLRANLVGDRRVTYMWTAIAGLLASVTLLWHGFALACFLLAFGASFVAIGAKRRFVTLVAFVPPFLLALYSINAERMLRISAQAGLTENHTLGFQGVVDKLSLLFSVTLMTRTGVDVAIAILLWILVIAYVITAIRQRVWRQDYAPERALFAAWVALALLFAALPHTLGWFGFVDGRVAPLLIAFASLTSLSAPDWVTRIRALFFVSGPLLLVLVDHRSLHLFQREARGFDEAIASVPVGARVLNLPLDPDSDYFAVHPYVHYDKLLLVERDVVPSDIWFHGGTAVYASSSNPTRSLPPSYSESNLRTVEWSSYTAENWDYALLRTRPEAQRPDTPPGLALERHEGGWWLYRFSHDPPK